MRLMTRNRVAIAGAQKNSGLAVIVPQHERRAISPPSFGAIPIEPRSTSDRPISIAVVSGMREYVAQWRGVSNRAACSAGSPAHGVRYSSQAVQLSDILSSGHQHDR